MSNQTLGAFGENLAKQYLQAQGYKILEVNFRCKLGEIDLIVQDGQTICFVEVKTRRHTAQGEPFEAVNAFKRRKLTQMAMFYLKYRYRTIDMMARFDVISIITDGIKQSDIKHIKNAFDGLY